MVIDRTGKEALSLLDSIYALHSIDTISFNGETGKKALLNWCKKSAEESNVKINDFTSSWRDGKAFSAIFNKYKPNGMEINHIQETLGLTSLNNEILDESVNLFIASELFHLVNGSSNQFLTNSSEQKISKKFINKF